MVRVPAVYPPKGRTIRKLIGERGGRGTKKLYRARENLNEKCKNKNTPKNPKKYLCISLKKIIQGKC